MADDLDDVSQEEMMLAKMMLKAAYEGVGGPPQRYNQGYIQSKMNKCEEGIAHVEEQISLQELKAKTEAPTCTECKAHQPGLGVLDTGRHSACDPCPCGRRVTEPVHQCIEICHRYIPYNCLCVATYKEEVLCKAFTKHFVLEVEVSLSIPELAQSLIYSLEYIDEDALEDAFATRKRYDKNDDWKWERRVHLQRLRDLVKAARRDVYEEVRRRDTATALCDKCKRDMPRVEFSRAVWTMREYTEIRCNQCQEMPDLNEDVDKVD